MSDPKKQRRLKKELRLLDVYAIATGATLSSGFFLLPGIAAAQAGPALIVAYLLAAVPLVPAAFSVIELATAMPRAGGFYYFLDRAFGPYMGTIGGFGTWLSLVLKVAFALVGMGAYVGLFLPGLPIAPVAVVLALLLGVLSYFGAKKGGGLQVVLVFTLLLLLGLFFAGGSINLQPQHFNDFFAAGFDSIIATTGMVYVSYVGVTKVESLSEEVRDPEKTLPRGVLLALCTAIVVYGIGTTIIVGLVPMAELSGNLTPVASAAGHLIGRPGVILISLAALLAFVSVANAGLMSASRYPLAMGRDHLLPSIFRRLSRHRTPVYAIVLTVAAVVLVIVGLNPLRIAKLASSFQLLMIALISLAVIVMRESHIPSYDPGYKSPFYPWMQIIGILSPLYLIFEMGMVSILFSVGLIVLATLWYYTFAHQRVARSGAIYHVFARLGQQRYDALDSELRGILREKGLRAEDPFEEIVLRSLVLDFDTAQDFEAVLTKVAAQLRRIIPLTEKEIIDQVMDGTRIGATPVSHGVALPHFRSDRIEQPEMVLVRCLPGVTMTLYDPLTHAEEGATRVHALFFLVSPEANPSLHLRILARIAERVDETGFAPEWNRANGRQEIKESLLHSDRFVSLLVAVNGPTAILADKALREINLAEGCLIAALTRKGHSFVPNGSTVLQPGDRLTVIGAEAGLNGLRQQYLGGEAEVERK
jgi:amino acid transporter/mannitol/fructose-specific phosphotransferase system IIA component (Ntr-type)